MDAAEIVRHEWSEIAQARFSNLFEKAFVDRVMRRMATRWSAKVKLRSSGPGATLREPQAPGAL